MTATASASASTTWLVRLFPRTWRDRHGSAARDILRQRSATFVDAVDLGLGALDAHLRTSDATRPGGDQPTAGIAGTRPSATWMALLFGHVAVFMVVNAILLAINLLTDRSTLWFGYPLWGLGIALLLHIGLTFPGRDFLRAHALLAVWIGAGLVGIDVATGGAAWAGWILWPMAALVVTHALRSRGVIDDFGAHALLTLLGGLELGAVAVLTPTPTGEMAMTFGYALAALLAHALVRFGRVPLLAVHVVLFVLVNGLLAVENAVEGGAWWAQYPLMAWSAVLALHVLIVRPWSRSAPADEATAALGRFAARGKRPPRERRAESFLTHAALFTLVAVESAVLFLFSQDAAVPMIWPLGAWLVVLAAHAGVLLLPQRPLFAIDLFGGATAALGLVAIDLATDGGPWAIWPVAGWLVVLAMHAGGSLVAGGAWFRPHLWGTVAAVAVLLGLYAVKSGFAWTVWPVWALAILLAIHAGVVALPRQPVLGAWVLGGGAISAGLVLIDLDSGGRAWAYWPVAVWLFVSVVLFGLGIDVARVTADPPQRETAETGS